MSKKSKSYTIALAKTIIYLFFIYVIFGTQIPFMERHREVDSIATSSVFNQVLYGSLFVGALICLWPKREKLFKLAKKEIFMTIFLIWCFISIFWSPFSFVSFKRFFRLFTEIFVCCTLLMYTDNEEQIINYFKPIVYLYLLLSLLSVLFIPGAIDPVFGTFRGLTIHKNLLGQQSLICFLLTYIISHYEARFKRKIFSYGMMIISVILIFGSGSTTSIFNLFAMILLGAVVYLNSIFRTLRIGNLFIFLAIICSLVFLTLFYFLSFDTIVSIPQLFGKDISFSGRVDLWQYMLDEIKQHLFFGVGYKGFWVMYNVKLSYLFNEFPWIPIQAHNGYLDIVNELGLIGLLLFLVAITNYFLKIFKIDIDSPWKWFVIMVLIHNFQETTLFRPGYSTSIFFILAYLKSFADFSKPELQMRPHRF